MRLPPLLPVNSNVSRDSIATTSTRVVVALVVLCTALALCACGSRQHDAVAGSNDASTAPLPAPDVGGGSVTGMSATAGPGDVPLTGDAPAAETPPADQVDLLNPETAMLPGGAPTVSAEGASAPPAEPGTQEAVAVVRDYYASINARSFARAYALWSGAGKASKQTPQQFADGFARTQRVTVDVGTPGNEDAGAGQRYLRVPVAVSATQADGSVRRYDGSYTLHRTVADGASDDERAWRIASADLRTLQP